MDKQILKDLIATAQKYNYDWDIILPKFPELAGYDPQVLKDYVATAEKDNYNYDVVDAKFPELFPEQSKKKDDMELDSVDGSLDSKEIDQPKQVEEGEILSIDEGIYAERKAKENKKKTYFQDSFMTGMSSLNEMISSPGETIYNVFALPQNLLSLIPGLEWLETNAEELKKTQGIKNPILDYYKEESQKLREKKEAYQEENFESSSIYENIKEGNYSDAFDLTIAGTLESAPVSLSMMLGGTVMSAGKLSAITTVAMTQQQREALMEEKPEQREAFRTLGALTMAGAESVFSSINAKALAGTYQNLLKREGVEAGKVIFKDNLIKSLQRGIEKYGFPVAAASEGIEEVATQITQNMVLGREPLEGAADAFILGASGGAMYGAPSSIAKATQSIDKAIKLRDNKKAVDKEIETTNYSNIVDSLLDENTQEIDSEQIKILSQEGAIDVYELALKKRLKSKLITKEEFDASMAKARNIKSKIDAVNDVDLSDTFKPEAVNLLIEKESLNSKIEGKDKALTVKQRERISEIDNRLSDMVLSKVSEEVETKEEAPAKEARPVETVGEILNRPVTINELGGSKLETPIEGDLYIDGQSVVVEDKNGNLTEIGNFNEIRDTNIADLGIDYKSSKVDANKDGSLNIEGKKYTIQEDLPTQGLVFDKDGRIIEASVKDENGTPVMFKDSMAEDIGYQILLNKATNPDQEAKINEQLRQDEEFNRLLKVLEPTPTTTEVTEEAAGKDTEQVTEPARRKRKPTTSEIGREAEDLADAIENRMTYEEVQGIADKAAKAIGQVVPKVKIVVHRTTEQYNEATGEEGSRGSYDSKKKRIHIDASKANGRTVAHEVFHAILLEKLKTEGDVRSVVKQMIKAVQNNAPQEVKDALNEFAKNYDENIQNEEKLAEVVGMIADNYDALPNVTKSRIKQFFDRLAEMLGLKKFTEKDVIDLLNTIGRKVASGEVITERELKGIPESKNLGGELGKRFQADFKDPKSGMEFVYDKNTNRFKALEKEGYLSRDRNIESFDGKYVMLHQPDGAFSGMIYKNGELLVEGKGGMFYPMKFHEDGYFWASTKTAAIAMANQLNEVYELNGGKVLMALTSAPYDKVLSSTTASNSVLDLFLSKAMDKRYSVGRRDVTAALKVAAKELTVDKPNKAKELSKVNKLSDLSSWIKNELNPENTTFGERKLFVESLVNEIVNKLNSNPKSVEQFGKLFTTSIKNEFFKGINSKGYKLSKTNVIQALSNMLTEPILKEDSTKGGRVYAVIELDSRVKPVEAKGHESYPMAIQSEDGSKVKLHILQDRFDWNNVVEDPDTNDFPTEDRFKRVYPSFGVTTKPVKINASKAYTRQQIDSKMSVADVIIEGKKRGISDDGIIKYLSDRGENADAIRSKLESINEEFRARKAKQEGLFNPNSNVILKSLSYVHKAFMSGRGFLGKTSQELVEQIDSTIEKEVRTALRVTEKITKIIENIPSIDKRIEIAENLDKYMRGDDNVDLPLSLKPLAVRMRNHIDNLSKKLVESGAIESKESIENIKNNIGQYIHRSYKIFSDKNYKDNIPERIIISAKNKLREMYRPQAEQKAIETNESVESILTSMVEEAYNEIINMSEDQANSFLQATRKGTKSDKILKRKNLDIPVEIRALMGEYTSPTLNYVQSISKIQTLISNHKFQEKLLENGKGVYIFDKRPTKNASEYTKIPEGSKTLSVLADKWIDKRIFQALEEGSVIQFSNPVAQKIYKGVLKGVGVLKSSKTIYSVGTHFKNMLGNIPFMIVTDNLSPKAAGKAFKALRNEYAKRGDAALEDMMNEYIEAGIINQSASLGEIRDMLSGKETFEEASIERLLKKSENENRLETLKKYGTRNFKKMNKFLETSYQVEDDFFKITAYESEKTKFAKALYRKKVSELSSNELAEVKKRAAYIVKNTLPNYGRVGKYIKFLKAVPLAGTFISFESEAMRTSFNTVSIAFEEMNDVRTREMGIRRLIGVMAIASLKSILFFGAMSALKGEDDEEKRNSTLVAKARKFVPFYDEFSDMKITQVADGKFTYMSLSSMDPHKYLSRAVNAYMSGEDPVQGFAKAFVETFEPYLQKDMLLQEITQQTSNQDIYGNTIFKAGNSTPENIGISLMRLIKLYKPGTLNTIEKIIEKENKGYETLAQFTGLRVRDVDVNQGVISKAYEIRDDAIEIKSVYRRAIKMYEKGQMTKKELDQAYLEQNEKFIENYEKARVLFKDATYFDPNMQDLYERLVSVLGRERMNQIINGEEFYRMTIRK